jgi:hypothetical protein
MARRLLCGFQVSASQVENGHKAVTEIVNSDLRRIVHKARFGGLHSCLDFLGSHLDCVPHPAELNRLDFPSGAWIVSGKEGQGGEQLSILPIKRCAQPDNP